MLLISDSLPDGVVFIKGLFTHLHPPQDDSVKLTQSYGRIASPTASALMASSPALPLSAPRAKFVVLNRMASVGFTPMGRALYRVTETAALLMVCCSAS